MRACKTAFIRRLSFLSPGFDPVSAGRRSPRRHLAPQRRQVQVQSGPGTEEPDAEDRGRGQGRDGRRSETVSATGEKTATSYTAEFDGKPHPLKGSALADMVTLKRIDANTTERVDSKGG